MPDPAIARDVLYRASLILADVGAVRWGWPELASWLTDAQREIALHDPSSTSTRVTLDLVRGTAQTLPPEYAAIIDVECNLRDIGEADDPVIVESKGIGRTERAILDEWFPSWRDNVLMPFDDQVEYVVDDPLNPRSFLVAPGNTGNGMIRLVVSARPATVTAADPDDLASYANVTLTVDAVYSNACVDYVVARALHKDIAVPGNVQRASAHMMAFREAVGIKQATEATQNPDSPR